MVILAAALAVLLAAVTAYVLTGDAMALDQPVHEWVVGRRVDPVTTFATVTTHAGSSVVLWIVTLVACGILLRRGAMAELALVAGVRVVSAVLVAVSKQLVGRDRPPVTDQLVGVQSPAFPSGHSLGSAAVVGVLAAVFWWRSRRRVVAGIAGASAVLFVALVGWSRIYLGVHWTTDVLAGWVFGVLLVVLGVLTRRRYVPPTSREQGPEARRPSAPASAGTGESG